MTKSLTTLTASVITAMALAVGVGAQVASAASAPSECTVSQLSAKFTPGSPGAGNRYSTLTLTNHSKTTCRTGGYAGLGLLNAKNQRVPTKAVRTETSKVRTIDLAPGHSASSQLHWGAVQSNHDKAGGSCFVAPKRILVTPPNSRQSLDLKWTQGVVCEAGEIDMTPLVAR